MPIDNKITIIGLLILVKIYIYFFNKMLTDELLGVTFKTQKRSRKFYLNITVHIQSIHHAFV
jgi:hypothetical protein